MSVGLIVTRVGIHAGVECVLCVCVALGVLWHRQLWHRMLSRILCSMRNSWRLPHTLASAHLPFDILICLLFAVCFRLFIPMGPESQRIKSHVKLDRD